MTKQSLGKHVSYDPDEKGYIMLDLTDAIPNQASQVIEGEELLPKDEYHTSLVSVERYAKDEEAAHSIAQAIKQYLQTHDLQFSGLGDTRYICRKDGRMTLIAPVAIEGIDEFRNFVSSIIPTYDPPFSHVTLLKSRATEFGIGINSMSDLEQYCKPFK